MTQGNRLSESEIKTLRECVLENKSTTIMMCKTGLSRQSVLNALRRRLGLKSKEINSLGTPYFQIPDNF